ncbi:MAG: ABC transporter permease [Acidobacteria bacterium]|nr:MAG: ABC transporter permease [Acidobacteriota bacterium]
MKIPLKYNFGSLWVRRVGTLMTALGIGLTVSVFIIMMALVNGLDSTFVDTGHENHLVVIRDGSLNEVNSYFNRDLFQTIRLLPGISVDGNNEPLSSGETVVIINHPRISGESSNVTVRGTSDVGLRLRPEVRIVQGRWFRRGLREIVLSELLSKRFRNMRLGDTLRMSRSDWKVVGLFNAGGTAYDSEIWADYEEIAQDWDRPIYSSILLQAEDAAAAGAIKQRIADDRRIHLQAIPQKEYFKDQTVSSIGIKALGGFIAVIMGIGSCFAAMNMMYGAIMSRSKEVGTLRALGFSRWSILTSFLVESVILACFGGVLGCLMALPLHGISTGTANFASFSEVLFHFRITPKILLRGMMFATLVGILGGGLPARHAARIKLIEALRD